MIMIEAFPPRPTSRRLPSGNVVCLMQFCFRGAIMLQSDCSNAKRRRYFSIGELLCTSPTALRLQSAGFHVKATWSRLPETDLDF